MEKILKKIKSEILRLVREKFTGKVQLTLDFNQGGIRSSRITLDKSL